MRRKRPVRKRRRPWPPGNAVPCQTAVPGRSRGETSVAIERGCQRAQARQDALIASSARKRSRPFTPSLLENLCRLTSEMRRKRPVRKRRRPWPPGNAVPCQTAVPGRSRGETSVAIERGCQRAQAPSGRADRVQRAKAKLCKIGHRGRGGGPDGTPLLFVGRPAAGSLTGRVQRAQAQALFTPSLLENLCRLTGEMRRKRPVRKRRRPWPPGNAVPCQTAFPAPARATSVAIERGCQRAQAPSGRADRVQRAKAKLCKIGHRGRGGGPDGTPPFSLSAPPPGPSLVASSARKRRRCSRHRCSRTFAGSRGKCAESGRCGRGGGPGRPVRGAVPDGSSRLRPGRDIGCNRPRLTAARAPVRTRRSRPARASAGGRPRHRDW